MSYQLVLSGMTVHSFWFIVRRQERRIFDADYSILNFELPILDLCRPLRGLIVFLSLFPRRLHAGLLRFRPLRGLKRKGQIENPHGQQVAHPTKLYRIHKFSSFLPYSFRHNAHLGLPIFKMSHSIQIACLCIFEF